MEEKGTNAYLIVPISFVVVFFIYLLLNPVQLDFSSSSPTGMGIAKLKENLTPKNIAIISVVLGGLIFIWAFTQYKQKKKAALKVPAELNLKPTEVDKKLSEEEINKIFSDENLPEIKKPIPQEKVLEPQKKLTNLNELITLISTMFSQNLSKKEIQSTLIKQGWTKNQIQQAVEELNLRTLKEYISSALKKGYSKQQIVYALNVRGWSRELIAKALTNIK